MLKHDTMRKESFCDRDIVFEDVTLKKPFGDLLVSF